MNGAQRAKVGTVWGSSPAGDEPIEGRNPTSGSDTVAVALHLPDGGFAPPLAAAMWREHCFVADGRVVIDYPKVGDLVACLFDQNMCLLALEWTTPERYAAGQAAKAEAYAELLAENDDPSGAEDGDDE